MPAAVRRSAPRAPGAGIRAVRDQAGDTPDLALAEAYRVLDAGEIDKARGLAQSALIAARTGANRHLEARALGCLAHCDRVTSRLRRSADTARHAAHLFQGEGDTDGEASALTTLAHVCMLLGRNDAAVEAAVLCVRLCDPDTAPAQAFLAQNCLGLAYSWAGNFDKANAALDSALHLAGRSTSALSAYEPTLNQLWVEALALADQRFRAGEMPNVRRMNTLVRAVRRLERDDSSTSAPGLKADTRTMSHVLKAICAAWEGSLSNANNYVDRAIGSLGGAVTWMDSLVRWSQAELSWARRDWKATEKALTEMAVNALRVEHEQLACMAMQLLAQVYETQGKHADSTAAYKELRIRERRMAADSTTGREATVDWQLGVRRTEQSLERALVASKQFEKWSFEDPLTTIANRRSFELQLRDRLAQTRGNRGLTVAMIDVDKFKSVNDSYGHKVGDQVLQTVAQVMLACVREHDLVARLAGDEFVILFNEASLEVAAEARGRIHQAMRAVDWEGHAPGLNVTISIGLSEAVRGDTVESLVERSDRSMYEAKTGWDLTTI